ncbi:hypothetical protein MCOR02_007022 [Pyricularia oryzae]|uniref:DUF1445 domain-containing protein n=1 Tax=Pyricularia oryzae TaxID=318829 RepID=A0A4P7NR95_PYROR|nr:hypothetical protein MCOR02_007022 [Pyricularia oryzae]KAI6313009.1 hypothetical protein MCOR34_005383 [Pyricularia oryzae]KAI6460005.1 hypothetical protein MCOR17_006781 [Pyricularia oryzae]KAI6504953.1 hypothetical protein MCOR13_004532 [Pyricularia oryzae]KAI6579376.1 hypothetical protein MCOR04_006082 [Pyricularia oryzae]
MSTMKEFTTGKAVRLAARSKSLTDQTSGLAPSYIQANLLVLPQRYADDFRLLCARNPVPCPLLAESVAPGNYRNLKSHMVGTTGTKLQVAEDVDLRHDFPAYRVYRDGALSAGGDGEAGKKTDIEAEWTAEHVGFLIGCSFSFEAALAAAGLAPRHTLQRRNVPMYRTTVPLCSAGAFAGATMVVSMRPYRAASELPRVRDVTRRFGATHGEPVAWGWDGARALGIRDVAEPEFGDAPLRGDGSGERFGPGEGGEEDGYVPVFWGCGVTPQEAVRQARLEGTVMAHSPGCMIVLDLMDHEVFAGVGSV